jgi:D-arabinose 1-dehydrogenase-like Zn-dependent alcohol dehydrogenase
MGNAQKIRVSTYDGPGAEPVIREVPWPKVEGKAALIQIGACGVCGTDLHILKGIGPNRCRASSRSATRWQARSSRSGRS